MKILKLFIMLFLCIMVGFGGGAINIIFETWLGVLFSMIGGGVLGHIAFIWITNE